MLLYNEEEGGEKMKLRGSLFSKTSTIFFFFGQLIVMRSLVTL
jgi:hypothetical protein